MAGMAVSDLSICMKPPASPPQLIWIQHVWAVEHPVSLGEKAAKALVLTLSADAARPRRWGDRIAALFAAVHESGIGPKQPTQDVRSTSALKGWSGLVLLVLSSSGCDPSETCAALDFCSAHCALSPVSLLEVFCFDDGS